MQLQIIRTGAPQYEGMAALRIRVLLDPISAPHSYVNPEKEGEDILVGAYVQGWLVVVCLRQKTAIPCNGGKWRLTHPGNEAARGGR